MNGLVITDTEYTHDQVPWHYHENAYLTFILKGCITETNKKETVTCPPGTLLFHNWQEPHCNTKLPGYAQGFHLEFEKKWLDRFMIATKYFEGSFQIKNPHITPLISKMYAETKIDDESSPLAIESLAVHVLAELAWPGDRERMTPRWAFRINQLLHDRGNEKITLKELSEETGMHPVHISRDFPKYFRTSLGAYLRKIKVQRSLALMSNANLSLADIAYQCGFADQSHFVRCFKSVMNFTPAQYRSLL
ncbi:helix-turn-helix transcriptional regulator [bacterium]|nr:helix-turn-helix transcriptional regulator [bacterium]